MPAGPVSILSRQWRDNVLTLVSSKRDKNNKRGNSNNTNKVTYKGKSALAGLHLRIYIYLEIWRERIHP